MDRYKILLILSKRIYRTEDTGRPTVEDMCINQRSGLENQMERLNEPTTFRRICQSFSPLIICFPCIQTPDINGA
ncbi:MAG: hypothetical protein ABIL62_02765, partial [Planctomycetota bacterium]